MIALNRLCTLLTVLLIGCLGFGNDVDAQPAEDQENADAYVRKILDNLAGEETKQWVEEALKSEGLRPENLYFYGKVICQAIKLGNSRETIMQGSFYHFWGVELSEAMYAASLEVICPVSMNAGAKSCHSPPSWLIVSKQELVLTTKTIVLAKAVEVNYPPPNDDLVRFKFESVTTLKGTPPKEFHLDGYNYGTQAHTAVPADLDSHRQPEFWAFERGSSAISPDCQSNGQFEPGEQYLIFSRSGSHVLAFENVKSKDDLWFKVVALLVEKQKKLERDMKSNGRLFD